METAPTFRPLSSEELNNDRLTQKHSELLPSLKKYCKSVIEEVKVESDDTTTTEGLVDEAVKSTTNDIRSIGKGLETDEETSGESTGTELMDSSETAIE